MSQKAYSLTVLGSEQSGKTCFLAGLGILGEGDRNGNIRLSSKGESKQLIQELASSLRAQSWPPGTTGERNFTGYLRYRGYDIHLRLVEYAGERFREALSQGRELPENLSSAIQEADYILLALDPHVELLQEEMTSATISERERYLERLDSFLEVLHQLRLQRGNGHPLQLGIMITKSDTLVEDVSSPELAELYFKTQAPNFYDRLKKDFPKLRVFSVSSVGNTQKDERGRLVPSQDLQPWGYESIFDWVIKVIKHKKQEPIRKGVVSLFAVAVIATLVITLFIFQKQQKAKEDFDRYNRIGIDADQITDVEFVARQLSEDQFNQQVDSALKENEEKLDNRSSNRNDIQGFINKIDALIKTGRPYRRSELDSAITQWKNRLSDLDFDVVEIAFENNGIDFNQKATEFLSTYPNDSRKGEVQEMIKSQAKGEINQEISKIHSLNAGSEESIINKVQAIRDFIKRYPNIPNRENIEKSIVLAEKMVSDSRGSGFRLTLKSVGTLVDEGYLKVHVYVQGNSIPVVTSNSSTKTKFYTFDGDKDHVLPWKPGNAITIELQIDNGWFSSNWDVCASKVLKGDFALHELDGIVYLNGVNNYDSYFISNLPYFECDVEGWDNSHWRLLKDWISPGSAWLELNNE